MDEWIEKKNQIFTPKLCIFMIFSFSVIRLVYTLTVGLQQSKRYYALQYIT